MTTITFYLLLHTINMSILKQVSLAGYPLESVLTLRGLGCITMALFWAGYHRLSLRPQKPKLQLQRLVIAGLGLGLLIASYNYINASTVAVLFKFDVIFLIFIGLIYNKNSKAMFPFAVGALVLLGLHIIFFKETSEQLIGYFLALGGTLIISMGFILLNKSGKAENIAVTCLVPGVSITFFGLLYGFGKSKQFALALSLPNSLLAFGSGIVMFLIYILTLKLYRKHSVVFAELLTFACILLFIPIEVFIMNIKIGLEHIASILIVASYTLWVYFKKEAAT